LKKLNGTGMLLPMWRRKKWNAISRIQRYGLKQSINARFVESYGDTTIKWIELIRIASISLIFIFSTVIKRKRLQLIKYSW